MSNLKERECQVENAIPQFLNQLLQLEKKRVWIAGRYWFKDPPETTASDQTAHNYTNICCQCQSTIQDTDCYTSSQWQWHPSCFRCSKCSASLNETNALLLENALYCPSCCELDVNHSSVARCTHVTLLQFSLNQLKAYLSTMSTRSTPAITSNLNGGNNQKQLRFMHNIMLTHYKHTQ